MHIEGGSLISVLHNNIHITMKFFKPLYILSSEYKCYKYVICSELPNYEVASTEIISIYVNGIPEF